MTRLDLETRRSAGTPPKASISHAIDGTGPVAGTSLSQGNSVGPAGMGVNAWVYSPEVGTRF